jgi:hypothetical protein
VREYHQPVRLHRHFITIVMIDKAGRLHVTGALEGNLGHNPKICVI